MATTLKDYAQQRLNRYSAQQTSALNRFSQLSNDYAAALENHSNHTRAYAELAAQISDKRRAMSDGDLMPSEIEELASQLRDLLRQQRIEQGEVLAADEVQSLLHGARGEVEAQLSELKELVAEASAELQQETAREAKLAQWNAHLADDAFSDLQAQATAVLDAADEASEPGEEAPDARAIWQAKQRLGNDIPEVLLERARERAAVIDGRLDESAELLQWMEDKAATQGATDSGLSGVTAQRWLAFERAEEGYRATVTQGNSRYAQAMGLLAAINASEELSVAETQRIADTALAVDAEPLLKEQVRDQAQDAVYVAQNSVEMALAAAQIADIDTDPETIQAVIDARDELSTKEAELVAAESDYDAAMREAVDEWEGALSNHTWNNLINFDRAVALLKTVRDVDLTALSSAMESAQSSLVSALEAEDQALRRELVLEQAVGRSGGQFDVLSNAYTAQLISRIRGDN